MRMALLALLTVCWIPSVLRTAQATLGTKRRRLHSLAAAPVE